MIKRYIDKKRQVSRRLDFPRKTLAGSDILKVDFGIKGESLYEVD